MYHRKSDGYRGPAGYRVQHTFCRYCLTQLMIRFLHCRMAQPFILIFFHSHQKQIAVLALQYWDLLRASAPSNAHSQLRNPLSASDLMHSVIVMATNRIAGQRIACRSTDATPRISLLGIVTLFKRPRRDLPVTTGSKERLKQSEKNKKFPFLSVLVRDYFWPPLCKNSF